MYIGAHKAHLLSLGEYHIWLGSPRTSTTCPTPFDATQPLHSIIPHYRIQGLEFSNWTHLQLHEEQGWWHKGPLAILNCKCSTCPLNNAHSSKSSAIICCLVCWRKRRRDSHLDPSKKAAIWNLTVTNFLAMAVSLTFRQPWKKSSEYNVNKFCNLSLIQSIVWLWAPG